ncbi:MAG: hypothetical protein QM820_09160 [Minicystis sp.]
MGEAASPLCRDLQSGDPHYPRWIRCCDRGDGTSTWTNSSNINQLWDGTCNSWGIY